MIRSVLAVAGGSAASSMMGAAGGLLVAKFASPEVLGEFRAYTLPVLYLTFLHLGTFDGINRQIPLLMGRGQRTGAINAATTAAGWSALVTTVVALAFVAMGFWSLLHRNHHGWWGWLTQAFVAASVYYGGYLAATCRTLDHFVVLSRTQALQASLSLVLVVSVPFLGFGGLCLRAAMPAMAAVCVLHYVRPIREPMTLDRTQLSSLIRIGAPFGAWGSLYNPVWVALEGSLVLAWCGESGLGLYSVAAFMRDGMCIIPQALTQVLTPRVVEGYGRSGHLDDQAAAMRRLALAGAALMAILVILVSGAIDLWGPKVLPRYADGIGLMKLLLWASVIQAAALPLGGLLAVGQSWSYGRGIIIGLLTFPLLAAVLSPVLGPANAVAVGSLSGRALRTAVGYLDLRRVTLQVRAGKP